MSIKDCMNGERSILFGFRLHGQTHQQFQMANEQFEDVSMGALRPAELIRSYGELYTDARVEALDALDRLPPLKGLDVLKLKICFSVVVVSTRVITVKPITGNINLFQKLGLR